MLPVRQKNHEPGSESEVPCGHIPPAYGVDGPVTDMAGPKISAAPAHPARPKRRPPSFGFRLRQPATRAVRRRILDAKLKQPGRSSAGQQIRQRESLLCSSSAAASDDEDDGAATDHDDWSPAATAMSAQKLVQSTSTATSQQTRSPRADELLAESRAMITSGGPQMATAQVQQPHQQLTARSRAGSAPELHSIVWDTRMKVGPFKVTLLSADEGLQADEMHSCVQPHVCISTGRADLVYLKVTGTSRLPDRQLSHATAKRAAISWAAVGSSICALRGPLEVFRACGGGNAPACAAAPTEQHGQVLPPPPPTHQCAEGTATS